jgi:UDP-2,4-diacetamido-2,4,6-trideoxy-beta-L-altropyranose hydrolase
MASLGSIFFRADAGPEIGTGHVMRCLALANAARARGFSTCFIGVIPDSVLQARILDAGHAVQLLHGAAATRRWLDSLPCSRGDWVVLDGYTFTEQDHTVVRNLSLRLLVVDDMNALDVYDCDIVLNQNFYGRNLDYACEDGTCLLLGPQYALLRREFLLSESARYLTQTRRVLVTLGGADQAGVGLLVMQGLAQVADMRLDVLFIAGSSNSHLDKIEGIAKTLCGAGHAVKILPFTNDMPAAMAWADVGIIAAGSTSLEVAYMGLPCLALVLADNQIEVARAMAEEGVCQVLGWYEQVSPQQIAEGVVALFEASQRRQEMTANGQKLIDGNGARRVLDAMLEY